MAHGKKGKRGGHGGGEHENAERWLLTYADMITLLTCFFIMLYAMSVTNTAKFQQLAISVRSGFGGSMMNGAPAILSGGAVSGSPAILSSSKSSGDGAESAFPTPAHTRAAQQEQHNLDRAFQTVKEYIKQHRLEKVMQVNQNERGVVITVLTDQMLFPSGQADLRPQETDVLAELAKVADVVPNPVRVEGHTDSLPIHNARFPSNWELSAVRATTVLRFFQSRGVSVSRLEAVGYADQRPLASNSTDTGRARNRRVEVVILRQFNSLPAPTVPAPGKITLGPVK